MISMPEKAVDTKLPDQHLCMETVGGVYGVWMRLPNDLVHFLIILDFMGVELWRML